MRNRVVELAIGVWLLLVADTVAAQSAHHGSYELRAPNLQVHAATYRQDDRPSFVAPLIITAAGFSVGASAVFIGVFSRMGHCSSREGIPRPGTEPEPEPAMDCDRSMPTAAVVTAIAGGAVGVLGGVWLVERLIARGAYNREQRGFGALHLAPTLGGAMVFGRF